MASRDKYAVKFEQYITTAITRRIKSGEIDPEVKDKHNLELNCPCCKIGTVQMEINTKHKTVMAKCTGFEDRKCGAHKVNMPYNVPPKTSMVENGIE